MRPLSNGGGHDGVNANRRQQQRQGGEESEQQQAKLGPRKRTVKQFVHRSDTGEWLIRIERAHLLTDYGGQCLWPCAGLNSQHEVVAPTLTPVLSQRCID